MKNYLPTKVFNTTSDYELDKFTTQRDLDKYYNDIISNHDNDMETAQLNAEILRQNQEEFKQIVELSKSFGYKIHDYVSGTRKRAGYYKDLKWVEELRKQLPSHSYYQARVSPEYMQKAYDSLTSAYKKRSEKLKYSEAQATRVEEQREINRKKDALAIRLSVKYGLPDTYIDRESILDALISMDKYIDLAIAMEDTRGDWSEGFYRVEDALGRFTVETQEDDLIYGDISGCVAESDGDGRIFRDTDYNYSILYTIFANQELLSDINSIRGE